MKEKVVALKQDGCCASSLSSGEGKKCAQHERYISGEEEEVNSVDSGGGGGGRERLVVAEVGSIVTMDLELTPENNYVPEPLFDTKGRISFVVGWGNYLPGLHVLTDASKVGDEMINIGIDAGWGDRNEDLVIEVSKKKKHLPPKLKKLLKHPDTIVVGMQISLAPKISAEVIEVTPDYFVLDANPRLAGASYSANVKVVAVENPPSMNLLQLRNNNNHNNINIDDDDQKNKEKDDNNPSSPMSNSRYQVASFGLGCFWGGELAFMRTPGVVGTKVGYTQGHVVNPTYEEVCTGSTRHTEAIWVIYNPDIISYSDLLKVAMERSNDNGYGLQSLFDENNTDNDTDNDNNDDDDEATQYRHVIFHHTSEQKQIAIDFLQQHHISEKQSYNDSSKIEVCEATTFYEAEEYHQQYLLKGGQSSKKGAKEPIRCFG
mmetsp:Transcript_13660/g.13225  ORF Transcript_13660/g.13225 Transcript_13660/m.13225 type:complete len:432 (-) Transcript_13660:86-1381(-)